MGARRSARSGERTTSLERAHAHRVFALPSAWHSRCDALSRRRLRMLIATRWITLVPFVLSTAACAASAPSEHAGESQQRVSAAECAAAQPWSESRSYAVGVVVTYAGGAYQCVQAHTSEPGWTPAAVPALWSPVDCGGGGGGSSGGGGGSSGGSWGGGSSCDANAWVYMANDPNACSGHIGESCGWTASNEGQGYHCQATSWGTGCEPGGAACSGGSSGGG